MRASMIRWGVLALLLAPILGCVSLPFSSPLKPLEDALLFHPEQYPLGDWQADDLAHEDAWITAEDATRLHAWFCPAEHPQAVLLYCHGNGGNLTGCKGPVKFLQEKCHVSVLIFDYRGYGKSEGTPDEAGLLLDARAARHWLAQRTGVAEADIVLLGRSLGGAVAVDLAARDGAGGLILENTFTSLPEVVRSKPLFRFASWLMTAHMDSLAKIGNYHGPLLQTHGDRDELIPLELGQKLFAAANQPKQFVLARGGGHNSPPSAEYYRALYHFLQGRSQSGTDS
jgi:fermentation-respiration switch protein FrsA (DUF1100 family)